MRDRALDALIEEITVDAYGDEGSDAFACQFADAIGLDHFEGRQWLGWYHHVTLVTMAYAFLRLEQARLKKNFWCDLAGSPAKASTSPD